MPPIRNSKRPFVLKADKVDQNSLRANTLESNSSKKSSKPKDYSEWAKLDKISILLISKLYFNLYF
jgi:hypothetical protein